MFCAVGMLITYNFRIRAQIKAAKMSSKEIQTASPPGWGSVKRPIFVASYEY